MSLFERQAPAPTMVEVRPGSVEPHPLGAASLEAKRKRAIAHLGSRWCLAGTRKDQIEQLKLEELA